MLRVGTSFLIALNVLWLLPLRSSFADERLDNLRRMQQTSLEELRAEYDAQARRVASKADGTIDTSNPEYQRTLDEYRSKATEIRQHHVGQDPRAAEIDQVTKKYNGEIVNTGSKPKDVRADVDLAASHKKAAENLASEWANRKDVVAVIQTDKGEIIKYVNKTTDTTLWMPGTEEIRKAKVRDTDAWTTEGGLKATGNRDNVSDPLGHYLDNEKKFLHGIEDGDIKTIAKSVDKVAEANRLKNQASSEFYEQTSALRRYQDSAEAGIVALGDSPVEAQRKSKEWINQADAEMARGRAKAEQVSGLKQEVRADLEKQMRQAGESDVADHISERMQNVEASNQAAQEFNNSMQQHSQPGAGEARINEGLNADAPAGKLKPSTVELPEMDVGRIASKSAQDVAGAVGAAASVADVASRRAGEAIDNMRDLNATDVAKGAVEATGIESMYRLGYEKSREQQIKVEKGEQGQARALANTAAEIGKSIIIEPVDKIVKQNLDEMQARAKNEGRSPTMLEGAQSYGKILAETAGHFTGVNQLGDAVAEQGAWQERANLAAQKHTLGQFVDAQITASDKTMQRAQKEMETLIYKGDINSPDTKARLDELIKEYGDAHDKLEKLQGMAERTLGADDPERVQRVKDKLARFSNTESMKGYADDILQNRKDAAEKDKEGKDKAEKALKEKDGSKPDDKEDEDILGFGDPESPPEQTAGVKSGEDTNQFGGPSEESEEEDLGSQFAAVDPSDHNNDAPGQDLEEDLLAMNNNASGKDSEPEEMNDSQENSQQEVSENAPNLPDDSENSGDSDQLSQSPSEFVGSFSGSWSGNCEYVEGYPFSTGGQFNMSVSEGAVSGSFSGDAQGTLSGQVDGNGEMRAGSGGFGGGGKGAAWSGQIHSSNGQYFGSGSWTTQGCSGGWESG